MICGFGAVKVLWVLSFEASYLKSPHGHVAVPEPTNMNDTLARIFISYPKPAVCWKFFCHHKPGTKLKFFRTFDLDILRGMFHVLFLTSLDSGALKRAGRLERLWV